LSDDKETIEKKEFPTEESLLVEYKLTQEMFTYFGKILWTIGTIFHPATMAGLAYAMSQNLGFPLSVLFGLFLTALQVFFLISYRRIHWLADIKALRCQEIEEILGIKQHRLNREADDHSIQIADKEIKPQFWSSPKINNLIPIFLIGVIWAWVCYTYSI